MPLISPFPLVFSFLFFYYFPLRSIASVLGGFCCGRAPLRLTDNLHSEPPPWTQILVALQNCLPFPGVLPVTLIHPPPVILLSQPPLSNFIM